MLVHNFNITFVNCHSPVNQLSAHTPLEKSGTTIACQNTVVFTGTGVATDDTNESHVLQLFMATAAHCGQRHLLLLLLTRGVGSASIATRNIRPRCHVTLVLVWLVLMLMMVLLLLLQRLTRLMRRVAADGR